MSYQTIVFLSYPSCLKTPIPSLLENDEKPSNVLSCIHSLFRIGKDQSKKKGYRRFDFHYFVYPLNANKNPKTIVGDFFVPLFSDLSIQKSVTIEKHTIPSMIVLEERVLTTVPFLCPHV